MRTEDKTTIFKSHTKAQKTNPADTLRLAFQPSELWDHEFFLFKLPNMYHFGMAAEQTNTVTF